MIPFQRLAVTKTKKLYNKMSIPFKALNDDLSSKFDDRMNSTDKQLLDCPVNALILSSNFDERSSFRVYNIYKK